MTYVQKDFVMSADLQTFKKKHTAEVISYELSNFNKKETDIDDLGQQVNNFLEANELIQKLKKQKQ